MSNWISITDLDSQIPENERILVFCPFSHEKIFNVWVRYHRGVAAFMDGNSSDGIRNVTHWKKLDESEYPECDSFEKVLYEYERYLQGD